jgi:hypothetical protein
VAKARVTVLLFLRHTTDRIAVTAGYREKRPATGMWIAMEKPGRTVAAASGDVMGREPVP